MFARRPFVGPHLAVIGALIGALLTVAHSAQAAQVSPENLAQIRADVARAGSARVIVRMATPATPFGVAPEWQRLGERVRDRAANAQMVASLRDQFTDRDLTIEQTFDNLPLAVVEVDAAGLEGLLASPTVASLRLDKPHPVSPGAELAAAPAQPQTNPALEKSQAAPVKTFSGTSSQERAMRADLAWALGATGRGQTVVTIGNGVESTHEALSYKMPDGRCFSQQQVAGEISLCKAGATGAAVAGYCPDTGIFPGDLSSACKLGTHDAGLIAGNAGFLRGMAFDALLIPMQVYVLSTDPEVCGIYVEGCVVVYESAVLNALNAAITLAASYQIAAVNLDVGGRGMTGTCDDDILKTAIDKLRTLGILTVIPSGDSGRLGIVERPGCISTAITVGSIGLADPFPQSNHSPLVDLLAPGESAFSAWPGNDYERITSTSSAAAHVAGGIAMLKSLKPSATAAEVENALKAGGILVRSKDWTWTTPRIDMLGAVNRILGNNPAPRGTAVTGVRSSGNPGGRSFLRFMNAELTDGVITATIVDETTGGIVANWSKEISLQTAPQFDIATIEANAVPSIAPKAGTTYTLYVDPNIAGYVQHVAFDANANILTNVTTCAAGLSADARTTMNVHTSKLPQYPSLLQVTNTGTASAIPAFTVRDAQNSQLMGTYRMSRPVPAGMTSVFSVGDVMESLGYPPAANSYHVDMMLETSFTGVVRHYLFNAIPGVVTDMSAKCDM